MNHPPWNLEDGLNELAVQRRYRRHWVVDSPAGVEVRVDGESLLSFCSNDYLGLAADERVAIALREATEYLGVGSGAAHLISGHSRAHHELEVALAEFTGFPRALLFSTGYMANLGVASGLLRRDDWMIGDRLNHASLLDGALLARAMLKRYAHGQAADLDRWLAQVPAGRRALVATDTVFSMDGDVAPVAELYAVCRARRAVLWLDEAHGLGVLGPDGRGALAAAGLPPADDLVLMGTLGKALGVFGAFVAASPAVIETLIQRARPYIYTTASPPALAMAVRRSLQLVRSEPWRRERLAELVGRFRAGAARLGFRLGASPTPIQPLLAGTAERALDWSRQLREQGLWVAAIRPPTVPEGSARLRITFSALHSDAHLERLLAALARLEPA